LPVYCPSALETVAIVGLGVYGLHSSFNRVLKALAA
jgi:hypothetical protein